MEVNKKRGFTQNKQKVREMNLLLIKKFSEKKKMELKYLGLPSEEMEDIICWKKYLKHISAVERGVKNQEYLRQHNILLRAFTLGVADIFKLYRGELDGVLISNKDQNGQKLQYPYDLFNLDYTGGVIYKEKSDRSKRIDSLKCIFKHQAFFRRDFMLIVTCNFDNDMDSEYKNFIEKFLFRLQDPQKKEAIAKTYKNPSPILKLKILMISLIQDLAKEFFDCRTYKPIFYLGNRNTEMINFSFEFKYIEKCVGEKKRRLVEEQIINFPILELKE